MLVLVPRPKFWSCEREKRTPRNVSATSRQLEEAPRERRRRDGGGGAQRDGGRVGAV